MTSLPLASSARPAFTAPGWLERRFPFLHFDLQPFREQLDASCLSAELRDHLAKARFSVRLLRYWWAGQALQRESRRRGRPLTVVDLGCERGWLKHFTPPGAVAHWIGLDWNIREEVTRLAGYDEVRPANFDQVLPVADATADAVVSLHVFEHLPRPGHTMSEVSRILRPGGLFLGCAPTMPDLIGRLRERHFRRRLREGRITQGGHITVLSPARWRSLAEDCGLGVEFATGSHLTRMTGSPLESWRGWIRFNQLWGALFPALGSECCLQARRGSAWADEARPLAPADPHWRKAWIGLAVGAAAGVVLLFTQLQARWVDAEAARLTAWMDAHQTGDDRFLVKAGELDLCNGRTDTDCVDTLPALLAMTDRHPHAHVLVSLPVARELAQAALDDGWRIDSRLEVRGDDYLLLRRTPHGTPLDEYLRTPEDSVRREARETRPHGAAPAAGASERT